MNNILIAEDESRIAAFIEKGLQKNGFETQVAADGEQALLMMQSHEFDLLLLDLGLPIKDGWTVLKELRNKGYKIPIIVVSAYSDINKNNDMTDCMTKPFGFQDLLTRIKSYL